MQISTTQCNMILCMTENFHNDVIRSFDKSIRNLHPRRMQTSILKSKTYLEAGSIWSHFRNLWNNIILSIPYTSGFPLRNFYGTRNLAILVINTSTTLTNILMESQQSATLLLKYLINDPLASKLICKNSTWPCDHSCCHTNISRSLYLIWFFWDDLWWQWLKYYEGINFETCWILITDIFTGMKHGYKTISKMSPTVDQEFSQGVSPNL